MRYRSVAHGPLLEVLLRDGRFFYFVGNCITQSPNTLWRAGVGVIYFGYDHHPGCVLVKLVSDKLVMIGR
jgi:hypothetical protein